MAVKKGVAFFEGNSWFHRIKVLRADGSTNYTKKGGFSSAEEAEQSYFLCEEEYKKACRAYQMSRKVDVDIGLGDYLKYWMEDVYTPRVQNTTRMIAAYVLYNLILPALEQDIKLKYVNAEFLGALLERVAVATESAGNKCGEFLNLAFKEAVLEGYIKSNPLSTVRNYPRRKPSVTVLSKNQIREFLSVAIDSKWYLEILLALFCGLRKGEILGLKYSDFDRETSSVRIQRQITSNPIVPRGQSTIESYQIEEKAPKTENSYRILRVPQAVMAEVEKRKADLDECKVRLGNSFIDNDYISCQENGLPHSITSFNTALTRLCEKNGFPHITVHGLRHMYATILLERGISLVKISALLGHSSVNTTFEYYCDQMDENQNIIGFMNNSFIPEEGRDDD